MGRHKIRVRTVRYYEFLATLRPPDLEKQPDPESPSPESPRKPADPPYRRAAQYFAMRPTKRSMSADSVSHEVSQRTSPVAAFQS